jgi:hypothetical protein
MGILHINDNVGRMTEFPRSSSGSGIGNEAQLLDAVVLRKVVPAPHAAL